MIVSASRERIVNPKAPKIPTHAVTRRESLIKPLRYSRGSCTEREIEGSRLKKYSHTNVWSAIRIRCEAPNHPSDSSWKRKPSSTVAKYHMNAHASSVTPIGQHSRMCRERTFIRTVGQGSAKCIWRL